MSDTIELRGPFYVELAYEAEGDDDAERIRTAYIDGIASEADAWAACGRMGKDLIAAITDEGDAVSIAPERLLQLLIRRTAAQNVFPATAAE